MEVHGHRFMKKDLLEQIMELDRMIHFQQLIQEDTYDLNTWLTETGADGEM